MVAARSKRMTARQLDRIVKRLCQAARRGICIEQGDGELLERFVTLGEEAAFEELLRRHGPMVLGVCRRILGNTHDADDAYQATFLVLVRKANSVMPRERVGCWLHGVACYAARKVRADALRRRARELRAGTKMHEEPAPHETAEDWRSVLDHELNRLPEKFRAVVVLCDLEGRSRREAARELGCPEGTLSSRLTTARRTLARRLVRHGFAVSGLGLGLALSGGAATAAVPSTLLATALESAAIASAPAASAISASVLSLTQGVLRAMLISKIRFVAAMLLACVVTLGAGLGVYCAQAGPAESKKPAPRAASRVEDDDRSGKKAKRAEDEDEDKEEKGKKKSGAKKSDEDEEEKKGKGKKGDEDKTAKKAKGKKNTKDDEDEDEKKTQKGKQDEKKGTTKKGKDDEDKDEKKATDKKGDSNVKESRKSRIVEIDLDKLPPDLVKQILIELAKTKSQTGKKGEDDEKDEKKAKGKKTKDEDEDEKKARPGKGKKKDDDDDDDDDD
jgi:RNA polymerase sigma factor (sigma-70 family)